MSAKPENEPDAVMDNAADCETVSPADEGTEKKRRRISTGVSVAAAAAVLFAFWIFIGQQDKLFRQVNEYKLPGQPENSAPAAAGVLHDSFQVMGTIAGVSVYSAEKDLELACTLAREEFDRVDQLASLYDPESELSRINASAADAPVVCSPEMWQILMRAKQAYEDSDGNFDITVKPLMDLWGFYRKQDAVPPDEEIRKTLTRVGFDKLRLDEAGRTVFFSVPGMALDLGGIAKGYAVDRAAEKISRAGISAGVIDIGGNLRMLSAPPPGKKFYRIAIRDPHDRNRVLPDVLQVAPGKAVASSGDYERFVIYNGKKYGHIISPVSGRPGIVSAVTVVTGSALDADIFSTSCALGGEDTAEKIKEKYPDTEIYFTR